MTGAVARLVDVPPEAWTALLREDPNATPAHRPDVWHALATTLPGTTVGFIAVEDERGLAGGAPVAIERRAGLRWLHALPYALSGAPLAREGMHRVVDDAVAVALAGLQRELELVGGDWTLYRPVGPEVAAETLERAPGETRAVEIARIDLEGGVDAMLRRLDRDARYELRRARSRGLTFVEDPAALEAAYALHLAQSRRWSGYRPLPLELSRRLLAPPAGPPGRLFTVRGPRGDLLGAVLFLDHARELFAWWSGARHEGRASHVMPCLFWSAAEWAARSGRARLNLGGHLGIGSLAAWKHALGAAPHTYRMRWLDASRATSVGRMVAALQQRARRARFRGVPA